MAETDSESETGTDAAEIDSLEELTAGDEVLYSDRKSPLTVIESETAEGGGAHEATLEGPRGGTVLLAEGEDGTIRTDTGGEANGLRRVFEVAETAGAVAAENDSLSTPDFSFSVDASEIMTHEELAYDILSNVDGVSEDTAMVSVDSVPDLDARVRGSITFEVPPTPGQRRALYKAFRHNDFEISHSVENTLYVFFPPERAKPRRIVDEYEFEDES